MIVRLLDVNMLLALLDSAHEYHKSASSWFLRNAAGAWSTCAITENGFVRVISSIGYPNARLTPAQAADHLGRFKKSAGRSYRFWDSAVSLADQDLFDLSVLTGSKQVSDAYLAGLAFHLKGRLATLDAKIPWQAVRGASDHLVERVPLGRGHADLSRAGG